MLFLGKLKIKWKRGITLNYIHNEKGLTLVEVIAGVVLLSIVLLSFFAFFTNAATFNAKNNDNISANNVVREHIANFTEQYNGETWVITSTGFTQVPGSPNLYQKVFDHNDYKVQIMIDKTPDSSTSASVLRKVEVSVWDGAVIPDGQPLSKSYTYHEGAD